MARFYVRWYAPKTDSMLKLRDVVHAAIGDAGYSSTDNVMAAIKAAEFEIEWPFWEMSDRAGLLHQWKTGEAASGEYCIIVGVYEAADEAAVRATLTDAKEITDVTLKPDGWTPSSDRFPIQAA